MKRAATLVNSGNDSFLLKKKASLFSIATLQEKDNEGESQLGSSSNPSVGLDLMRKGGIPSIIISTAEQVLPPPPLSCTEDSSCGEEDDESHDTTSLSLSGTKPILYRQIDARMQEVALPIAEVNESSKTNDDDLRTGIVFEEGAKHFDRHNRFHKERPIRITSIMQALKTSEDGEWDRCHILGEESSTELATKFLDDEDYLRVHLPGYMKR
jgi:hypothetical protein